MAFYTDRSRIETYQRCPRSRWHTYHNPGTELIYTEDIKGTGLRRKYIEWDLLVGSTVHQGIEGLLKGWGESISVEGAMQYFDNSIEGLMVEVDKDFADPESYMHYKVGEQRALAEALIRVFAKSELGMHSLLQRYEVLEVEAEEPPQCIGHTSEGTPIMLQGKCDALLRERRTGDLYVLSTKTTSGWDERKERTGQVDMQGKSEVWLVEQRLKQWQQSGKDVPQWFKDHLANGGSAKIEGVQYLYLVKGSKKKDKDGIIKVSSTLIRPYKMKNAIVSEEYRWQWQGLHYTKWAACNIWEEPIGVEGWIEHLTHEYSDEYRETSVLAEWIITPEPYRRGELEIEDWHEQVTTQEVDLYDMLETYSKFGVIFPHATVEPVSRFLNVVFPQHSHSCLYPLKCRNWELCYGPQFVKESPLATGDFLPRIPHHEAEATSFKKGGTD